MFCWFLIPMQPSMRLHAFMNQILAAPTLGLKDQGTKTISDMNTDGCKDWILIKARNRNCCVNKTYYAATPVQTIMKFGIAG